jgi:hypothetical protein
MDKAEYCLTCGVGHSLTPSHLFKRNAPYKGNNPADPNLIVVQCLKCHMAYEPLNVEKRIEYWQGKGFKEIVQRMKNAIDWNI